MKQLFVLALLITLCSFVFIGCSKKVDNTPVSNSMNNEVQKINLTGNYNWMFDDLESFVNWIKDTKSKDAKEGAFLSLIKLYNDMNYVIKPRFCDSECDKVFVDSNISGINYMFLEAGIRVYIEPLLSGEKDIVKYIKDNYGYSFNEIEAGNSSINNTDTECEYHYVTKKNVKFYDCERECVLEKQYSSENDTMNKLSFIQEDMLYRIIYYESDDSAFELDMLSQMWFEKLVLSD